MGILELLFKFGYGFPRRVSVDHLLDSFWWLTYVHCI